jgi:hypothetical protein
VYFHMQMQMPLAFNHEMAGPKPSVDVEEVWARLKASTGVKVNPDQPSKKTVGKADDFDKVWASLGSGYGSNRGSTKEAVDRVSQPVSSVPTKIHQHGTQQATAASGGKLDQQLIFSEEQVRSIAQKCCESLKDPAPGVRRQALSKLRVSAGHVSARLLQAFVLSTHSSGPPLPQETMMPLCHPTHSRAEPQQQVPEQQEAVAQEGRQLVADLFESFVGKSLLRRFDDASEAGRELATSTFLDLLQVRGQIGYGSTVQLSTL